MEGHIHDERETRAATGWQRALGQPSGTACLVRDNGSDPREELMSDNVYVGVARLELHVSGARSLKEKRSHTRSLIERIRNRHKVLVMEADHQDLYQRTAVVICGISTDPKDLEARLRRVSRTVDETWGGHVLGWDIEVIQV